MTSHLPNSFSTLLTAASIESLFVTSHAIGITLTSYSLDHLVAEASSHSIFLAS